MYIYIRHIVLLHLYNMNCEQQSDDVMLVNGWRIV